MLLAGSMKLPFLILCFVLIFIPVGCQKDAEPGKAQIALRLEMPASLEKHTSRYSRFAERVLHMKVKAVTKEGVKKDYLYTVDQWEQIHLAELDFPKTKDDWLDIHIQVWDKKTDGTPRTYPVLLGKKRIGAEEVNKDGSVDARLKLSLQVSSADFDIH